jgi:serine/threonine-protein kinase
MYPAVGDVIEEKYRIDQLLGEGGMGAVFLATHLIRRAQVALKFMSPTAAVMAEAVDRFRNEAVAASDIDSAHVVKIYDVGKWGELPYLVMEFLEGRDLAADVARAQEQKQYLEVPRAVHFTLQILRALQAAHAKGIVHRDLKPANAFVITSDGEPDFVKLVDFGISKKREGDGVHLTKTNVTMGTPLYMSPEQARSAKDADARSDLYSVAAILYELLVLQPPFPADDLTSLITKLLLEQPKALHELRPDVPPELDAVVQRGLAKDPNARYQTAAELAHALAPFADHRSGLVLNRLSMTGTGTGRYSAVPAIAAQVAAAPRTGTSSTAVAFGSGTAPPIEGKKRSPLVGVAIGVVVATVGLGVVGFVAFGRDRKESPTPVAAATAKEVREKAAAEPTATNEPTTPPKSEPAVAVSASSEAAAKGASTAKAPGTALAPTATTKAAATATASAATRASATAAPTVAAPTAAAPTAPTAPTAKSTGGSTLKTMRPDD